MWKWAAPGPAGGESEGGAAAAVDEKCGDGQESGAEGLGDREGVGDLAAESGGPADEVVGQHGVCWSQALLALNDPNGRWARPPALRSRIDNSTTAWARCWASRAQAVPARLVTNAW